MVKYLSWIYFTAPVWVFLPIPAIAQAQKVAYSHGGIIRGGLQQPKIALVFTGHEYAEGGEVILDALQRRSAKASFFFTGDFYRKPLHQALIKAIKDQGHYLGAHSDRHLLYCDWNNRDSLLVTKALFREDLKANYRKMKRFGIGEDEAIYYLPPYEWYNDSISRWTREMGLHLVNFTPGTRSNADYTTPDMPNYLDSESIFRQILAYEAQDPNGLNGFILLLHIGVGPKRPDEFSNRLPELLEILEGRGYEFVGIDELLDSTLKQ